MWWWWIVPVVLAGFAVIRVAGVERGTPLTQLVSFTPYVTVLAWAAAAVTVAGGVYPALLAAAAAAALTSVVAPRALPARGRPVTGVPVRVMTANLLYHHGDAAALLDQIKTDDVDVVAVQELTTAAAAVLAQARDLLPHRVTLPGQRGDGTGLYSRHPLTADGDGLARRHPCGMQQTAATLHVPGARPVIVESAHPCAPHPGRITCWAGDLAAQPPAGGPTPRILMGDFNATLDHAPLRRLLRTGYRDAAAATGRGLATTWPYRKGTRKLPVPPVTLDHILLDAGIGVTAVGTRTIVESDHRAVVADLTLPPLP